MGVVHRALAVHLAGDRGRLARMEPRGAAAEQPAEDGGAADAHRAFAQCATGISSHPERLLQPGLRAGSGAHLERAACEGPALEQTARRQRAVLEHADRNAARQQQRRIDLGEQRADDAPGAGRGGDALLLGVAIDAALDRVEVRRRHCARELRGVIGVERVVLDRTPRRLIAVLWLVPIAQEGTRGRNEDAALGEGGAELLAGRRAGLALERYRRRAIHLGNADHRHQMLLLVCEVRPATRVVLPRLPTSGGSSRGWISQWSS